MQDAVSQDERWTLWFDKRGTPVGVKGGVMIGSAEDYERTLDVVPASERDRYREAVALHAHTLNDRALGHPQYVARDRDSIDNDLYNTVRAFDPEWWDREVPGWLGGTE